MGMVERSSFFRIQDSYCVDSINDFWNEKRAKLITQLHPKGPVVILGDARMDSPGFCAQYCTYTAMDNDSKNIICMINIDKRETQRNSVIMEKEGFKFAQMLIRRYQPSSAKGTSKIAESTTLDIWHGSKNLGKKVLTAGQQMGCSILQMWNKDICNHFWYCCKTADHYEDFFDMWTGLLHHVTGEHSWALGACKHGPLLESREKEWIQQGSVAHQRLTDIILGARWLKNVHKYLRFRSTADLESFNNHILMYASKRFSFSPTVYAARTLLAGLDYNHQIHRPAKRKEDGSIQYGKLYNKRSRAWRLHTLKVEKNYSYIPDLQSTILRRRLSATKGMPRIRAKRPDDPRQHGVLSGAPAPTTQELLQKQVSRGLGELAYDNVD
ncbi:S-adenosylmethionine decarboxylase proenzyme [Dissostichus eleginoides]|uniref:S-adenosylmethionine decarboxylase proenzyme n=1 Tax=Dissostichus eleginoides TaxID=100907 RepID=A0AAD9F351_DISEL|nr:S-adenosylmethionine decarboxylase proenzyme [Dissostichus eleginoides]